jgi:predicted RNA-binding Zn-ribbon protein involved in translation (DUF1610 family)
MSLLSTFKGWVGEVQGTLAKKIFLDPEIYKDVNNITIPTSNGTTQIDHVVVSRFGIFVVETKNYQGWIFGSEDQPQWTQCLPGGKKFKFQNPLRQNYRHIKVLSEFLGLPEEKFHSVVMFWGESEFKTPMPVNVMDKGYATYFKSKVVPLFGDDEVEQIITAIKSGILPKTWATRTAHIESLKERQGSTMTCPKCGAPLVLRTAKSGKNAGEQFYGCSKYPACRYTKAISATGGI